MRRLLEHELQYAQRPNRSVKRNCEEMIRVVEFISKVWQQVNNFIEKANCPDVSIGARLFLNCPMIVADVRPWFVSLWNGVVIPYLSQAAKEGLATYGRRGSLEDPTDFVCSEWPWAEGDTPESALFRLSPDDISIDSPSNPRIQSTKADPLVGKHTLFTLLRQH